MICLRAWLVLALCSARGAAQSPAAEPPVDSTRPLTAPLFVGSPRFERQRMDDVLGASRIQMYRSPSGSAVVRDSQDRSDVRWRWLVPRAELTWNSTLPFSLNDGAQWAGRGVTVLVAGGVWGSVGRVRFILAPEVWRAQNESFPVLPGGDSLRSGFASPWFYRFISADLPVRFGYRPTTGVNLGESTVWMTTPRVEVGISTESQWWGPGVRNALLLSNHAGGVPHAFARTTTPLRTRLGSFEAKWIVGALSESRFFDGVSSNDLRSLSGAIATFTPAAEPQLTAGVARVVYSRIDNLGALTIRSFDFIARRGGEKVRSSTGLASEQLLSFFGRWRMPGSSAEVYGEWGRLLLPRSVREFLIAPQFTQAYTVGAMWLPPLTAATRLRLHLEFTNLEQSPTSAAADTISYYTSSIVAQGYTHRGQSLGAAIGPGSSSQWLALDMLRPRAGIGVFVGRIRWNTDAYYLLPVSINSASYDVSFFGGVRGDARIAGRDLAGELVWQRRLNFLFQNAAYGFSTNESFDRYNTTFRLRLY